MQKYYRPHRIYLKLTKNHSQAAREDILLLCEIVASKRVLHSGNGHMQNRHHVICDLTHGSE